MRLLFDAHLDIAWNALSYDRDQLLSIADLRAQEAQMTGKGRARCTVSLPQMRTARVGICLATVLSRALPPQPVTVDCIGDVGKREHGQVILRENLDFANRTIASATGQGQLAYYRLLEEAGHMRMIRTAAELDDLAARWRSAADDAPIGYILSMEGADPIVDPGHAQWWWNQGLRAVCLAHYGPSAYAMGTGGDGPLTVAGRRLLEQFDRLGVVLDLVHTADTALAEALDQFGGPVFVSHGNCRALVNHDRQISDGQIRHITDRGGVIGAVCDCWMIHPDWTASGADRNLVTLATLADHIDHVCQLVGNCLHCGIGSDLDGGFGTEQCPGDLETIVDLHRLATILADRGYADADIDAVFHANWLRFFRDALPQT